MNTVSSPPGPSPTYPLKRSNFSQTHQECAGKKEELPSFPSQPFTERLNTAYCMLPGQQGIFISNAPLTLWQKKPQNKQHRIRAVPAGQHCHCYFYMAPSRSSCCCCSQARAAAGLQGLSLHACYNCIHTFQPLRVEEIH